MATPNYGFTNEPAGAPPPQQQQGNGLAVAGLVLGIIGAVLFFVPFIGWIVAILGIIFGAVGMSKANKIGGKGKGMAMAGLILGLLGLIAGIIVFYLAWQASKSEFRYRSYQGNVPALIDPAASAFADASREGSLALVPADDLA